MDILLTQNSYTVTIFTGTVDLVVNQKLLFGQQAILKGKKIYAIELEVSDYVAKCKNGTAANISATQAKSFNIELALVNPLSGQQQQPFDQFGALLLVPQQNGLQAVRRYQDIEIDFNNSGYMVNSALSLSATDYAISTIFYYR